MTGSGFRASSRRVLGSCALLAGLLGVAPSVRADSPALDATLICAPAAAPGRILCELTINAPASQLVWGDALVVQAPPFARPLRSRVAAQAAPTGAAAAKLALVASAPGKGELQLLVRAVLCHEAPAGEWCGPQVLAVSAAVEVAQAPAPTP